MIQLLKCEINKIITLKSLLIVFFLPLVMATIGLINVYAGDIEVTDVLDALYNQSVLGYAGLFLPITIAIIVALQWRIEYKHNSILLLYSSPINLVKIYFSKIITTIIFVFINVIMFISILLIFSRLLLPSGKLQLYFIYSPLIGLLFSIPLILIQHLLSMVSKNFLLPIAIGLISIFCGFMLISTNFGIFVPTIYTYYGMLFNIPKLGDLFKNILFIIVPILTIIISFLGTISLKNMEV
ncbi:ABC transporter permease [Clostridium estertheticum]|uniref:ABC transporter permease n=1 Tax=Clostridium estertheticum TaxID=238834 RepID=UPI001CF3087F|nr:ABC transporter permease [Clostridium estertheticum]MCB2356456.1 ABC transporter permease [Clostridium estertheticum]WAG43591.1 ABC transporter permease [Clostridium estertheticum]